MLEASARGGGDPATAFYPPRIAPVRGSKRYVLARATWRKSADTYIRHFVGRYHFAWYLTGVTPETEQKTMILAYIGNLTAALISVGLLVGTMRFTRRAS